MSVDFDKFDNMIDKKKLKEQMDSAPEYDDVPRGVYIVTLDNMSVKQTKSGDKLMFSVQMAIKETVTAPKKQDKRKIFFNRVIAGNKTTEKWNDGVAIKGVISWITKMLEEDDTLEFTNYSQFADDVDDIFNDIASDISLKVQYDPEAFNSVTIIEVYDE